MTLAQEGAEIVASTARANVELRFIAIAHKIVVAVEKGENKGRTLDYTNVVLAEAIRPCDPSLACRAPIPPWIVDRAGADRWAAVLQDRDRSEEHTSELQSLMRIPYTVFCLKKKNTL